MDRVRGASRRAAQYGIDISLIEANLCRTPTDRIRALQNSLNLASALRNAGEKYYAKLRNDHKKSSR